MAIKNMTMDEHIKLGKQLKGHLNSLTLLSIEISDHYGVRSQQLKEIRKAISCIKELKNIMDNRGFEEYPEEFTTHIYY